MNKRILLLDNYDSFTYNLVHAINEVSDHELEIAKNDEISLAAVEQFDFIILSPGPGLPNESGILNELIAQYGATKKLLGVCLGLQAIAEVYGAKLKNLDQVYHGIETPIYKTDMQSILYQDVADGFLAGRYHSWAIDQKNFGDQLLITSKDETGEIMSIQHKEYAVHGVQFHPESFLTKEGNKILRNFFELA